MELPTISHLIYIPVVLIIGLALGFRLGAKAARDEIARESGRRKR